MWYDPDWHDQANKFEAYWRGRIAQEIQDEMKYPRDARVVDGMRIAWNTVRGTDNVHNGIQRARVEPARPSVRERIALRYINWLYNIRG